MFKNDYVLDTINKLFVRLSETAEDMASWFLEKSEMIGAAIGNLIEKFANWIKGFEGLGFGQSIVRALTGVFEVMSDMIVGAIAKGFAVAMPDLSPFKGVADAEEKRIAAIQAQGNIRTMLETGKFDANEVGEGGYSKQYVASKGHGSMWKTKRDEALMKVWTEGMSEEQKKALTEITGDWGDLFNTKLGMHWKQSDTLMNDMVKTVLQQVKNTLLEKKWLVR